MNSRMDKYYNSNNTVGKRSQKNEELYRKVSQQAIENFNVNSNASVLSDNGTKIDLEMLKDMLDKKYSDTNKRKTINLDNSPLETEAPISLEETKEYDINAILEKARENKTVDYEKERLKKIRDTQYDILKSLDLTKKEEVVEEPTEKEEQLMTLINTISLNEQNIKDSEDPLDLFADLKGDNEDTKVMKPINEETQNINTDKIKKVVKEEVENQIDRSFYTSSFNLSKSDFEDFKDLQDDVKSNKILVTILTIIVILAFLFGVFIFLNIYFKWGIL